MNTNNAIAITYDDYFENRLHDKFKSNRKDVTKYKKEEAIKNVKQNRDWVDEFFLQDDEELEKLIDLFSENLISSWKQEFTSCKAKRKAFDLKKGIYISQLLESIIQNNRYLSKKKEKKDKITLFDCIYISEFMMCLIEAHTQGVITLNEFLKIPDVNYVLSSVRKSGLDIYTKEEKICISNNENRAWVDEFFLKDKKVLNELSEIFMLRLELTWKCKFSYQKFKRKVFYLKNGMHKKKLLNNIMKSRQYKPIKEKDQSNYTVFDCAYICEFMICLMEAYDEGTETLHKFLEITDINCVLTVIRNIGFEVYEQKIRLGLKNFAAKK